MFPQLETDPLVFQVLYRSKFGEIQHEKEPDRNGPAYLVKYYIESSFFVATLPHGPKWLYEKFMARLWFQTIVSFVCIEKPWGTCPI